MKLALIAAVVAIAWLLIADATIPEQEWDYDYGCTA